MSDVPSTKATRAGFKRGDRVSLKIHPTFRGTVIATGTDLVRVRMDKPDEWIDNYWDHEVWLVDSVTMLAELATEPSPGVGDP